MNTPRIYVVIKSKFETGACTKTKRKNEKTRARATVSPLWRVKAIWLGKSLRSAEKAFGALKKPSGL